jgi:ribonuclease-3
VSVAGRGPKPADVIAALLGRLDYTFESQALIERALTHRSHSIDHNERLEFIGDAVLNCVIAQTLYERFPQIPEGDLSRVRASLVNRNTLARLAADLDIGRAVRFGEGEQRSGGPSRPSILADALEAIFGAVFVDGGYDRTHAVISRVFAGELTHLDPATLGKDPKTRLQEWLQARKMAVPEYVVTAITGEAHAQSFAVECRIAALGVVSDGNGPSRRDAEQLAAARAYEQVTAGPNTERGRA